jgi:hypothetical protein
MRRRRKSFIANSVWYLSLIQEAVWTLNMCTFDMMCECVCVCVPFDISLNFMFLCFSPFCSHSFTAAADMTRGNNFTSIFFIIFTKFITLSHSLSLGGKIIKRYFYLKMNREIYIKTLLLFIYVWFINKQWCRAPLQYYWD